MKLLSCDLCNEAFAAETFEDWMKLMMPHYMANHADFMKASKDKPKEEQKLWMAENKARFDAA